MTTSDHQELARELAGILESTSNIIASGGPDDKHREEMQTLLSRAASMARAWAAFGRAAIEAKA